jgi:hypothetical protein
MMKEKKRKYDQDVRRKAGKKKSKRTEARMIRM